MVEFHRQSDRLWDTEKQVRKHLKENVLKDFDGYFFAPLIFRSSYSEVSIKVIDENDNGPVFEAETEDDLLFKVLENVVEGRKFKNWKKG